MDLNKCIRTSGRHLFKGLNILLLTVILTSCAEEDLTDPEDDRDVLLGKWNVTENCSRDAYSVEIVKDPSNSSQVIINNFWNGGSCANTVFAIVAGNDLFIPKQTFCNGDFEVDGSGDLDNEEITWTYSVNDGADLFTCSAVYSRP
jgi:hypothetical protein